MVFNKDCIHYTGRNKSYAVLQNGKKYRVVNELKREMIIYEVDPCLINNNHQQKCDYLLLISEVKAYRAYFIELKGAGLTDAINQINSSVDILYKNLRGHKIFGRIVGKRVTPNIKSRRVRLDEKLKQLGGDLKIVSACQYTEVL